MLACRGTPGEGVDPIDPQHVRRDRGPHDGEAVGEDHNQQHKGSTGVSHHHCGHIVNSKLSIANF